MFKHVRVHKVRNYDTEGCLLVGGGVQVERASGRHAIDPNRHGRRYYSSE